MVLMSNPKPVASRTWTFSLKGRCSWCPTISLWESPESGLLTTAQPVLLRARPCHGHLWDSSLCSLPVDLQQMDKWLERVKEKDMRVEMRQIGRWIKHERTVAMTFLLPPLGTFLRQMEKQRFHSHNKGQKMERRNAFPSPYRFPTCLGS